MARGWESKSVEAQIDAAQAHRAAGPVRQVTQNEMERIRHRESLTLSRTRVLRELENATSERYREVMRKALADLDARLASLK